MEDAKGFRVVIVGSSVSGLTLGHCLHKAGIDFVILEKHNDVLVEVGATIIISANGGYVLDQVGLQEALETKSSNIEANDFREGKDARLMGHVDYHLQLVQKRTGYGLGATTRAELLSILFNNFPQPDKILTGHSVNDVVLSPTGVSVNCTNGKSFKGDIVVGADGIHSTIRGIMWKQANKIAPGYFNPKDEVIPAEYRLLFGISNAFPNLPVGIDQRVAHKGFAFLTVQCSGGRCGWFFFQKLEERVCVPNIPRYSQKDAEAMVQPYMDYSITERVKFRDLWDNRIVSGLVPLEEYLAEKWTWNRIVCVGDAIRKTVPTSGQGGNTAIEDVAQLANQINRLVVTESNQKPDTATIEHRLQNFQKSRWIRAQVAHQQSQAILRTDTLATPFNAFLAKRVIPNFPDLMVDIIAGLAIGSAALDYLPAGVLARRGNMYRANGESAGIRAWRAAPILLTIVVFFYFGAQFFETVLDKRSHQSFETDPQGLVKSSWGYKFPSNSLMYRLPLPKTLSAELEALVEFYFSMLTNEVARARASAFWFEFNAILGIMMAEGRRRGNFLSLALIYPLFVGMVKLRGAGSGVPLYCFFHYLLSPITNYRSPDLRHIPTNHAQTLLPAILLGFTLPTAYLMLVAPNTSLQPFLSSIAAWQFFPILVPAFQMLFKALIPRFQLTFVEKPFTDLNYVRVFYAVCALASTLAYWYLAVRSPLISTYYGMSFDTPMAAFKTMGDLWATWLQVDILAQRIPMIYLIALNFRDLKAVGRLQTAWVKLVAAFCGIAAVFSPGSAFIAAWAYREELLASWKPVH